MSLNEPRSIHAAEDWGVVLQSIPSKKKKGIAKHIEEIFELEKHDAERALSNMPLILLDNISFGLAVRVKTHFQKLGAVVETTNHDMIKKNCFQIVWPEMPDLSFFLKDETKSSEVSVQRKKEEIGSSAAPFSETQGMGGPSLPVSSEKSVPSSVSSIDQDWERRAKELHERLRKIQEEKERLHDQHEAVAEKVKSELQQQLDQERQKREGIAKAHEDLQKESRKQEALIQEEKKRLHDEHAAVTEKVKSEFQQQLDQERQKREGMAKAHEDLQKEARKQEALIQEEGKEWRSKATALSEKIRELETNLTQKTSAVERLTEQKDDLSKRAEKAAAEIQREIGILQQREQELIRKIDGLEKNVGEVNGSLRARDEALNQFEKQVQALVEKAREYELLREEHAQLVREREEYNAKLAEQEDRLAKAEDEHRRYKSRADRKNAAATRELGEWVRDVDAVRQGLQKLIVFLGSESEVLDAEKKSSLRSPLTRGANTPNTDRKKNL